MSPEMLLYAPRAILYKVENGFQRLEADGPLTISFVPDGNRQRTVAEVGGISWTLSPDIPSLKAEALVYTFATPDVPHTYLCLMLPVDTPQMVQQAFEQVLEACSLFHTVTTAQPAEAGPSSVPAEYLEKPAKGAEPGVAGKSAQPAIGVPVQHDTAAAAPGYVPPAGYTSSAVVEATPAGVQHVVPSTPAPTSTDQVAGAISKGGKLLQKGIKLAAAYSALAIQKGTEYAIKNTAPADKPYEVNPQLQARLATAQKWTGRTAKVATAAAEVTATVVGKVARTLAGSFSSKNPNKNSTVRKIGGASIMAAAEVLDELEDAARLVLAHSGHAATAYVHHKYGAGAAAVTYDASLTAQNVYETVSAGKQVRTKAIVKAIGKETAKHALGGKQPQPAAAGAAAAGPSYLVEELNDEQVAGGRLITSGPSGSGSGYTISQPSGSNAAPALAAGRYYPAVPAP